MNYPHVLSPIRIRNMEVRNRVAYPAMATRLTTEDGFVTDELIAYHVARAKGGNGLNILECTSVHKPSAPPNFLCLYSDEYIPGFKKLTDSIHEVGGRCCVQLWQGGSSAFHSDQRCVAVIPNDMIAGGKTIPAASIELIQECAKAFGEAAKRAVEAGFDCVEFHGGHGYSPHVFLSPAFNKRTDIYGGSFENRARYPLECIRAIRANVPEDFPVIMRIVACDDFVEVGNTVEDTIKFINMAKAEGVDAVNVSRGNKATAAIEMEVPPLDYEPGFNVENAAKIKAGTGMVTMTVGRIIDPDQAEAIIAEGKADMVIMGRAQICDPEFWNKARDGRPEDIVKCVGCNQGCYDGVIAGSKFKHISCLRNPSVGEELTFSLDKTDHPKKVLVIGAGMAGMECAFALKKRGHDPILVEAGNHVGGQFYLAGLAPRKREMADAALSRGEQLKKAGVDIRLNTKADAALLDEIKPDEVIVAMGAAPVRLNIPGADRANIYDTIGVLTGDVSLSGDTVVVGGGLVGLEVAEYIAERGCKVTVVEMLDEIAKDVGRGRKISILRGVQTAGIKSLVNTKCIEINDEGVVVEAEGKRQTVPCDNVVASVGSKPVDFEWVKQYCAEMGIAYRVVGDAVEARRAIDAVHEGVAAARAI